MPDRHPHVAGRFYPGTAAALQAEVRSCLEAGAARSKTPAAPGPVRAAPAGTAARLLGLVLPHAGYFYCGNIIGAALSGVESALPESLVMLCPNHTGQGHPLGVWPEGRWLTPLGPVAVDAALSAALCASEGGFAPDLASHLGEHSIEVLLPFLQSLPAPTGGPCRRIAPVCVGTRRADALRAAGHALAGVLRDRAAEGRPVGLIVSSDMNHYDNQENTLRKDALALSRALACDPDSLLAVVERENISMCGAGPLALALYAARELGEPWAELALYDTSAAASGDAARVVGYAGLRFGLA